MDGQVVAGVGVQVWGSLAGIQQGSNKKAEEGPHSPLEAAQSLGRKDGDRLSQALSVTFRITQTVYDGMCVTVTAVS